LTEAGVALWPEEELARLVGEARREAGIHLRRVGAVPLAVLARVSPFGVDHALELVAPPGLLPLVVDGHFIVTPPPDSALLRQCRKTLVVTGTLSVAELVAGLRQREFPGLAEAVAVAILRRHPGFQVDDGTVQLSVHVPTEDFLAASEKAGFDLLRTNGGAMLWWDFLDAMVAAGFSTPMAANVLRKPAVRRMASGTYALRGSTISPELQKQLARRRRVLASRGSEMGPAREAPDGSLVVDYVLNRFALQGVLRAPPQLEGLSRRWTAVHPDGGTACIKIARGFIWPVRPLLVRYGLKAGDSLRIVFTPAQLRARIELPAGQVRQPAKRTRTREEQILEALFGQGG
jgi:hypothetical protein